MKTNKKSKQPEILTGRIISNNGDKALLELTDDAIVPIHRGYSPTFEDIFAEDFLRVLEVGQRFKCRVSGPAVYILGTTEAVPCFEEAAQV